MLKKSLSLLAGALMLASVTSCNKYKKTESGLEYKIVKDSTGEDYPELGGFIAFWFEVRNDKDSIIDSQFGDVRPAAAPIMEIKHKPSIEEGLMLLTEGDSAEFLLNADSLYINSYGAQRPSFLKEGSTVKMIIKVVKVYSKHFVDSARAVQAQQMAEFEAMQAEVYKKDSIIIQEYLKKHKLKGESTIGGAYVVKLKKNTSTDLFISSGEAVETKYLGKLLTDGTEFDKSGDEYFKFTVGVQQVIPGWDQAFQKLKHGEKALILVPSRLAYGDRGAGGKIPPNTPLLFEVEVK
ncbi:MAG: FKBP-type peptidyl-prolyl cis-trans isomerase [Cytophaga sp.]|uniref:FKBP-type peptidyl-prolyl cis-trans isomerase n=1 Tax=Cytophaga sp. TaxID=29535 RepID=UPI003F7E88CC